MKKKEKSKEFKELEQLKCDFENQQVEEKTKKEYEFFEESSKLQAEVAELEKTKKTFETITVLEREKTEFDKQQEFKELESLKVDVETEKLDKQNQIAVLEGLKPIVEETTEKQVKSYGVSNVEFEQAKNERSNKLLFHNQQTEILFRSIMVYFSYKFPRQDGLKFSCIKKQNGEDALRFFFFKDFDLKQQILDLDGLYPKAELLMLEYGESYSWIVFMFCDRLDSQVGSFSFENIEFPNVKVQFKKTVLEHRSVIPLFLTFKRVGDNVKDYSLVLDGNILFKGKIW